MVKNRKPEISRPSMLAVPHPSIKKEGEWQR